MKQFAGRCTNFDYCATAESRRNIFPAIGASYVCPECGKPLWPAPQRTNFLPILAAALTGAVLAGGGYYVLRPPGSTLPGAAPAAPPNPVSVAAAPAPIPVPMEPPLAANPVVIPALATMPVSPSAPAAKVVLSLSGSNTIGAVLGPKLAQAFLQYDGDSNIAIVPTGKPDEVQVTGLRDGKQETITVAAHGSATAFTDLASGAADIGMASRRVKPAEATALAIMGDMTAPTNEHVLALDGIAVIVNPHNGVESLSIDQLRGIFNGSITNWSQLGLPAGDIHVLARDDKSGTYDTFKSLVLGTTKLVAAAKRVEDSRELSADVTADANAIGFIGLPYILDARAVPIADTHAAPLLPTRLTVGTEDYALARRLYLYTPQHSNNPLVSRFTEFALSSAGQAIAEQVGFIPLEIKPQLAPVPETASAKYRTLVSHAARLSTDFRFRTGSVALDNRALRDLDRLVNFVVSSHASPDAIILVGFADNQGNPEKNLAVSRKRADAVAAGLAQRGLKITHVGAFGADLPVADNTTPDGREKNRRVEVFVRIL
jgi:phosphate transport system substrate-binding protein